MALFCGQLHQYQIYNNFTMQQICVQLTTWHCRICQLSSKLLHARPTAANLQQLLGQTDRQMDGHHTNT